MLWTIRRTLSQLKTTSRLRAWRQHLLAAVEETFWVSLSVVGLWGLCAQAELLTSSNHQGVGLVIAAFGASITLLISRPRSPMSAPWNALAGSIVSAVIGICLYRQSAMDPLTASALSVILAILAMHLLHAMHPPGGAIALLVVLGSPAVHTLGWAFVVMPIGIGTLWLLVIRALRLRWMARSMDEQIVPESIA